MKYCLCLLLFVFLSCKEKTVTEVEEELGLHFDHIPAMTADSTINVFIEIPAGSTEKWELDKVRHILTMDSINDQPRHIDYLGYPANYGMIPNTLSPKDQGGDGDPLDVIVLGPQLDQSIHECKVLGVLKLKDRGEIDDKLIAVVIESPMTKYSSLEELELNYPRMLDIIEMWFTNYKGVDKDGKTLMKSEGYHDRASALTILKIGFEEKSLP